MLSRLEKCSASPLPALRFTQDSLSVLQKPPKKIHGCFNITSNLLLSGCDDYFMDYLPSLQNLDCVVNSMPESASKNGLQKAVFLVDSEFLEAMGAQEVGRAARHLSVAVDVCLHSNPRFWAFDSRQKSHGFCRFPPRILQAQRFDLSRWGWWQANLLKPWVGGRGIC